MSLKALDALREWSHRYDNKWLQPDGTAYVIANNHGVYVGENYGEHVRSMLDAVEAEVAERFCEIPVDVNGELCKCGDEIHLTDEDERLMVCGYTMAEDGFVSLYCSKLKDGRRWFPTVMTYASEVEHVKPRTVEDVLREFASKMNDAYNDPTIGGEDREDVLSMITDDYAAELRELLGGDA